MLRHPPKIWLSTFYVFLLLCLLLYDRYYLGHAPDEWYPADVCQCSNSSTK